MSGGFAEAQGGVLDRMDAAGNYNAWLLERARPYLGRRVLDAGAGTGTFTAKLAEVCAEVVAVEPDPALLPALHSRVDGLPNVHVVQQPLEQGIDVGRALDAVICFNVLEHVADEAGMLAALYALVRPGGTLLLLVPAHELLFGATDRALAHERRYSRPRLQRALADAGFAVEELRYVNPIGALGWLVSSRLLRREQIPAGPLALYDRAVPVLRVLDALRLPFGLSVWAVARRVG